MFLVKHNQKDTREKRIRGGGGVSCQGSGTSLHDQHYGVFQVMFLPTSLGHGNVYLISRLRILTIWSTFLKFRALIGRRDRETLQNGPLMARIDFCGVKKVYHEKCQGSPVVGGHGERSVFPKDMVYCDSPSHLPASP